MRPIIEAWTATPTMPWPYWAVDFAGLLPPPVRGTRFSGTRLGGVRVQAIEPASADPGRVILHFHGGAFLVGGWYLHRGLLSRIAKMNRAKVLSVQYRKLPKHPISTSIEDCVAAYRGLLESGTDASDVVLLGDSAGGYLAFTVLAAAARDGLPMPAGVVAMSPLCDVSSGQMLHITEGCAVFGRNALPTLKRVAARRETDPNHLTPRDAADPLSPPILIQAARSETLFPQIERQAQRLVQAGVACELEAYDLDIHVFQAAGWVPEAQAALANMRDFMQGAWIGTEADAALA